LVQKGALDYVGKRFGLTGKEGGFLLKGLVPSSQKKGPFLKVGVGGINTGNFFTRGI